MKLVIEDEDTLQKVLRSITGDTSLVKVSEQELHELFDQKLPAVYFSVDDFKSSRLENMLALCIRWAAQLIKSDPQAIHFYLKTGYEMEAKALKVLQKIAQKSYKGVQCLMEWDMIDGWPEDKTSIKILIA